MSSIRRTIEACIPLTVAGQLARWGYVLEQINSLETKTQSLSDEKSLEEMQNSCVAS